MSPPLAVVADNSPVKSTPQSVAHSNAPESLSSRVQRLQAEARTIAAEHLQVFAAAIDEVARLAAEVSLGGEAYPVGARELARQTLADCEGRRRTLDIIVGRSAPRGVN